MTNRENMAARVAQLRDLFNAATAIDASLPAKEKVKQFNALSSAVDWCTVKTAAAMKEEIADIQRMFQTLSDELDATAPTRLAELEQEIGACLDDMQAKALALGALLLEARDEFKSQGKQAEFLPWCALHFCIGKAWAYRLMKVSEVFGKDTRFTGVATRVLYSLAVSATPEQMERAAELAANSSLNTGTLQALLNPVQAPAPKPETTPAAAQDAQAGAAASFSAIPEQGQDEPPFDMGDEPPSIPQHTPEPSEVDNLRKELAAALAEIRRLSQPKAASNAPVAPMLPQFSKGCSATVLGLTPAEASDPAAIKQAFRDFVRLGYGSEHPAFKALESAKEALLLEVV